MFQQRIVVFSVFFIPRCGVKTLSGSWGGGYVKEKEAIGQLRGRGGVGGQGNLSIARTTRTMLAHVTKERTLCRQILSKHTQDVGLDQHCYLLEAGYGRAPDK